jgi:dTDP-4-dehydrorhamnose reductase
MVGAGCRSITGRVSGEGILVKILITGGTGQLGRALERLGREHYEIVAPGSGDLNVTDYHTVTYVLSETNPDLVIHAGAMTDVDGCEHDVRAAFSINGLGTQNVAASTANAGIPIVYVSTNFVFNGVLDRPYTEFDIPDPISIYGASKLAGERAITALNPRHYIVRTAMVYDESGRNFVNSMLSLAAEHPKLTIVDDQFGNPTYAGDLAFAILQLIQPPAYGIYHLVNTGTASWYEWAIRIFEMSGIETPVEPIPASQFKRAAAPPSNGALDNLTASALGIELPRWDNALQRCLQRRSELSE